MVWMSVFKDVVMDLVSRAGKSRYLVTMYDWKKFQPQEVPQIKYYFQILEVVKESKLVRGKRGARNKEGTAVLLLEVGNTKIPFPLEKKRLPLKLGRVMMRLKQLNKRGPGLKKFDILVLVADGTRGGRPVRLNLLEKDDE